MVPRREGKGLVLRGSAHVTCPLPALLSRAKCRGPGSGCPAANREGLCASWQELGRARRCWVGAGRALGQSGLRSWAGSAASTFLGLPGSGCVCGRRASAWQLLTFPTAHPDGPTSPPGNVDPMVSWPSLPRPPPGRSPRVVLPARHCPQAGCSLLGAAGRQGTVSLHGQSPPRILHGRPRCAVLSLPHTGCSPWPALLQPRKAAGDWDRKDERMGKEEDGREPTQPTHPGPGDASLLTEIRSVGPKAAAGECVGTQGRKEAAGILLILSFPGCLLLPWLGSALCYNQARVLHREGPECGGSTPGGCALTMSPWLAVPEVPTAEGAAPMAPLPLSLSLL